MLCAIADEEVNTRNSIMPHAVIGEYIFNDF